MAALFARDLVPLAIVNSAALMRLFLAEAYASHDEQPVDQSGSVKGCDVSPVGRSAVSIGLPLLALALFWASRRK